MPAWEMGSLACTTTGILSIKVCPPLVATDNTVSRRCFRALNPDFTDVELGPLNGLSGTALRPLGQPFGSLGPRDEIGPDLCWRR